MISTECNAVGSCKRLKTEKTEKAENTENSTGYTCGYVLACMQTEEFEMHASTKITGLQLSYMPGINGFISQSYNLP